MIKKLNDLNTRRKVGMLSVIFLLIVPFTSCKKSDSDIGLDIQGGDALGLNTIDTFEIRTYTELRDSVNSSRKSVDLLGSYRDPKFGAVEYGFVTQLLLSSNNPNFGIISSISVDSVVLALKFSTINSVSKYGELDPQTFEVYEITEDIYKDTAYYMFSSITVDPTNLVEAGTGTMTPNPFDDAIVGDDTISPQLRIRIDTNFGWKLINADATGDLLDNTAFKAFMKGIQVKVNNGMQSNNEGAILYFDLKDVESKLTVYYKEDTIPKFFDFVVNEDNARFNQGSFDYSGTYIDQVLNDTLAGQSEFHYQANSLWAAIEFPDLEHIKNQQGLIVNKAELIIPASYYPTSELFVPSDLFVFYKDLNGKEFLTPDFSNPDGSYYESDGSYHFLLTRYVQRIMTGEYPNNGIRLSNAYFFSTATRAIFNGVESTNKNKPKLVITYSNY